MGAVRSANYWKVSSKDRAVDAEKKKRKPKKTKTKKEVSNGRIVES